MRAGSGVVEIYNFFSIKQYFSKFHVLTKQFLSCVYLRLYLHKRKDESRQVFFVERMYAYVDDG